MINRPETTRGSGQSATRLTRLTLTCETVLEPVTVPAGPCSDAVKVTCRNNRTNSVAYTAFKREEAKKKDLQDAMKKAQERWRKFKDVKDGLIEQINGQLAKIG